MIIGSKEAIETLRFYEENYTIIPTPCTDEITFIDNSVDYVCRFCGKDKKEETFKKIAHAIPELIGNKTLLTKCECDTCNSFFGENLEDHLGRFLLPFNALRRIKGKNGIPTYKDSKIRIETKSGTQNISSLSDSLDIDEENKNVKIKAQTQRFIPIKVYKAFLKMALSIMPESELKYFYDLVLYVKEEKDSVAKGLSAVIETFTPGSTPYSKIMNFILIRKNDSINIPYVFYIVAFGNSMYQIIVPSLIKDKNLFESKATLNIIPFPSFYDFGYDVSNLDIRNSSYRKIDLSGIEPEIRDVFQSLSYESIIKSQTS